MFQSSLGSASGDSSNLVEFRAGRMNLIGKMVHPDTRKGLVYMNQSEDGLMHFCWKDRTTGKVEDDLIVFPDDFEFKRVDQCKTGRVYVLIFKTSSRRMFFWMQEPKTDKDDDYCRRVNEYLNNPPSVGRSSQDNSDLQYMLNNMSQQQLMQLFGGVGQMGGLSSLLGSMNRSTDSLRGSSRTSLASSGMTLGSLDSNTGVSRITLTSPKTKGTNDADSNFSIDGLSTLTSMSSTDGDPTEKNNPNNLVASNAVQSYNHNYTSETGLDIDLSYGLTGSEAIKDIVSDPERVDILSKHLPEMENLIESRKEQIKDTIISPQFHQALSLFCKALQSGQLGPVISQFELNEESVAAAYAGNMEEFLRTLDKRLIARASQTPTDNEAITKETTENKGKQPKNGKND